MTPEREKEKFTPITVTFETYEEAAAVMALCGRVSLEDKSAYQAATHQMFYALNELGVTPAGICGYHPVVFGK